MAVVGVLHTLGFFIHLRYSTTIYTVIVNSRTMKNILSSLKEQAANIE
jgi:hypothetical protein